MTLIKFEKINEERMFTRSVAKQTFAIKYFYRCADVAKIDPQIGKQLFYQAQASTLGSSLNK